MTDMHSLAGELGVSTAVIQQAVIEITGSRAGEYALPAELAAQVRERLRGAQRSFASTTGSPMFSGPAQPAAASRPASAVIGPLFAGQGGQPKPAQGPRVDQATGSLALSAQLAEQSATVDSMAPWRAAGLGPHDGHIIELCERHGLTPDDLRLRVDGRTVASRLKNGESMSSVRSRMS